ncbi:hypothetical protein HID58_007658, partial [Brassica napus]
MVMWGYNGDALIQQAEDALTRGVGKVIVGDIVGLHNKYMDYIGDCFQNHSHFHNLPYRWNLLQKSSALMYYKSEDRDTLNGGGRVKGKVLVREIAGLHDKYMDYVGTVFRTALSSTRLNASIQKAEDAAATGSLDGHKHSLFHNAKKDAFKIFCNEEVAGSPSAVLLATYCKKLLKKAEGDDTKDDISTMFRFYHAISKGLEPVAEAFRIQVTTKGNGLIEQAEYALTSGGSVEERKLDNRLLLHHSVCDEHERSILTKLRGQFGAGFYLSDGWHAPVANTTVSSPLK